MRNDMKWVACWGNATSITNRREAVYAKDLTLRYPVRMPFNGSQLRFRFSNLTGTEPVTLTKGYYAYCDHLHPSERAYEAMAQAAAHKLIRHIPRYDHEELF